jgi:hypothetical protein
MSLKGLIGLLFSRLFLFAFFQLLIALLLHSWIESTKYWLLSATLTNIVSISLLIILLRREGKSYFSLFHFRKKKWKNDLLIFSGLAILSLMLVIFTPLILQSLLWDNTAYSQEILLQPLPKYLIYLLLIAFPVSIAFAELPTYFGYLMPRLKNHLHSSWMAVALPIVFLSIQHCTLPLLFDAQFILFRGLSYLPFALLIGISLYKRPALLPYFVILHGLLDASAVAMYFIEI